MIKNFHPTDQNLLKANVALKDGRRFLGCDIPPDPFANNGLVMFWDEGSLCCVPIADIISFTLYVGEDE